MDVARQFEVLGRKQLAIQEGVELLRQSKMELARAQSSAATWGLVAVMANVTMIPLNCIVNAFELKAASTLYQAVVRQLYGHFGKSGTRIDGAAKSTLSLLKQAMVDELKRKGLTQYVPGVSILVGLTEDSLAAWQVLQKVDQGSKEAISLASALDRRINAALHELVRLGVKRAEALSHLQAFARTA